jgi:hypothetical protein
MKSEGAIAGYFSRQKLLKKARAHVGCRAKDDDDRHRKRGQKARRKANKTRIAR